MKGLRSLFVFALLAAACLDPLYEDGAPLTSGWVLCCPSGEVSTCFCDEATSCQRNVFPCASGRCSATPFCPAGTGGGAGAGGGAGTGGGAATGGGAGGGTATGGGAASGGGGGATQDAGVAIDGGVEPDAGVIDGGTGGGAGGGSGGGAGGGAGGGTGGSAFEFCCVNSRVTTCTCPASGCTNTPFTPCPNGSCVMGTSNAICR